MVLKFTLAFILHLIGREILFKIFITDLYEENIEDVMKLFLVRLTTTT